MNKIKVVKQHDLKDCGVCSLACIILYYGGYVSIEKLRLDTHTGVHGTNALNLIEASKNYGFISLGVKVVDLLNEEIKLPAIAHVTTKVGLDHFVVLYKISKNKVYLMDPAKGKVSMPVLEFMGLWNNVLLQFYPKQKIIFMKKENSLFNMFLRILVKEKRLFEVIFLVSLFLTILSIINSYYFKVAFNGITENQTSDYLKWIILVFGVLLILKVLFGYFRRSLENHLNKNIDVYLLREFLNHLFHLPLEVISSRTSGEVSSRIKELMNIKSMFTDIFVSCILDLSLVFISVPILYSISNRLFYCLFLMIALYFTIGIISSKIIYKMAYHNIEFDASFNTTILDVIQLNHSLKNLSLVSKGLKKIEKSLALLLKDNYRFSKVLNTESTFKVSIYEIGLFVINTMGFWLILKEQILIVDLITFNTLAVYLLDPFKNIIDVLPKYMFVKASFTKVNEFLSMDKEIDGEYELLDNYDIVIRSLTYSYNHYHSVLKNVSLEIKEGDFVFLKGKSGCGKSTLCKILDKSILEYEGKVLIGGVNLADLSIKTIRDSITYVSQNECLFTGTIKENIIFDRDVSILEFERVCAICQIEEIVDKRPGRYETIISNEASFISGGERQRIILARALLKDAKIYLLDEALSEVDKKLEQKIIKELQKHLVGKTILYISHKEFGKNSKKMISLEENDEL